MRHQLKPKTPSARARMHYILRSDRYGVKVAELAAAGVANLPSWADGPAAFWSAVDGFERKNARLCLELELNLPREISRDGQVAAVADYIDRLTAEAGKFPITWAIHDSGDGNPHVHLMLQERPLDGVDRDGPKAHFKRADKKRPERGGVEKSRWWHSKERVFWSRALWADACNQQLLAAGQAPRFDARRKSERLDEALRAGDLRAAAALCTQTERHEGVKVAAARKKLECGWIEAADLPEQVMQIISGNDSARHYNNWLLDWSRTATDKELRLFLADHLHDLHKTLEVEMQGTHIAAWMGEQHRLALIEDADRELADLIAVEQAQQHEDLTVIELEQAHVAALAEDRERTARQIDQLRDRVSQLDQYAFYPPRYDEAVQLVKQQRAAEHAAAAWRAAHPLAARALDAIGLRSHAEREADRAREASQASPAVQEAAAWQRAERQREQQLADTRGRLEQLQARMPALQSRAESPPPEPQAEAAREWVEWEQDGELYGQWEDDQQVYWLDDQGEWLRAEDRPAAPEPEPEQQRYSGPRMG